MASTGRSGSPSTTRTRGAVGGPVAHAEAHRQCRVVAALLVPGLGDVALQQLHVRDVVHDPALLVLSQLLGEEAHDLGRRQPIECGQIMRAIGRLHLAQGTLEGVEIGLGDRHQLAALGGAGHRCTARRRVGRAARVAPQGRDRAGCAGIGWLVAALEEADREPDQDHDQRHLQQQANDRAQAAQAAEQAVAQQHAEQPGADQPAEEAAAA